MVSIAKWVARGVTAVGLVVAAATAQGAPIFAGYPAPGGTTFSGIGLPISPGGRTGTYSGFSPAGNWDALYFNFNGIVSATYSVNNAPWSVVQVDTTVAGPTVSGNTISWSLGTLVLPFASTPVTLLTTFYDLSDTAIPAASLIPAPSPGMPNAVLALTPSDLTTWGGGFKVKQEFLASPGVALGTWYDGQFKPAGHQLSTSTSGAFWYDPPTAQPVPEPASLLLLGGGLVGLRAARRRRTG